MSGDFEKAFRRFAFVYAEVLRFRPMADVRGGRANWLAFCRDAPFRSVAWTALALDEQWIADGRPAVPGVAEFMGMEAA